MLITQNYSSNALGAKRTVFLINQITKRHSVTNTFSPLSLGHQRIEFLEKEFLGIRVVYPRIRVRIRVQQYEYGSVLVGQSKFAYPHSPKVKVVSTSLFEAASRLSSFFYVILHLKSISMLSLTVVVEILRNP